MQNACETRMTSLAGSILHGETAWPPPEARRCGRRDEDVERLVLHSNRTVCTCKYSIQRLRFKLSYVVVPLLHRVSHENSDGATTTCGDEFSPLQSPFAPVCTPGCRRWRAALITSTYVTVRHEHRAIDPIGIGRRMRWRRLASGRQLFFNVFIDGGIARHSALGPNRAPRASERGIA